MYGIIGGTGLYQMDALRSIEKMPVKTPFGDPSAPISMGKIGNHSVAFLPRHGVHHEFLPGEINYRANIWALKFLGVTQIIGVNASGSLRQEIRPGDLILPNQYFDWTKGKRDSTFFGKGIVAHVSTAQPTCSDLRNHITLAAKAEQTSLHTEKTYACVEGPRLGTRAESFFLRNSGADIVGMTNIPEAFLAREAQLCYATLAIATDYDCWLEDASEHVTSDKVLALYKANLSRIQNILKTVLTSNKVPATCSCRSALEHALVTPLESMSAENRAIVDFLRT